eukprot:7540170-Pyramimonas_sp.AAC.1
MSPKPCVPSTSISRRNPVRIVLLFPSALPLSPISKKKSTPMWRCGGPRSLLFFSLAFSA